MVHVGPQRHKKKTIFRLNSQCLDIIKYRLFVNTYILRTREATRFSESQGIPRNVCNPRVHYRVYKSPTPATCTTYLILLDLITRTILGEDYRSFNFSSCSFPHSPDISFILGQIFSSAPYSQTPLPALVYIKS